MYIKLIDLVIRIVLIYNLLTQKHYKPYKLQITSNIVIRISLLVIGNCLNP